MQLSGMPTLRPLLLLLLLLCLRKQFWRDSKRTEWWNIGLRGDLVSSVAPIWLPWLAPSTLTSVMFQICIRLCIEARFVSSSLILD